MLYYIIYQVMWVDLASIHNHSLLNETNKLISRILYQRQFIKKQIIKDEGAAHKFKNDFIITLIGSSLDEWLNTFNLVENENNQDKKNNDDQSDI